MHSFFRSVAAAALAATGLGLAAPAAAHDFDSARPDGHAPIGVMGDHTHRAGDWMLSYRYGHMAMDGNRDGTRDVSSAEVLRDFMVSPTSMDVDMHMFGVMWAPADRITLMAMLPYVRKEMDHVTRAGRRFTTRSDGLGDVSLTALVPLLEREGEGLAWRVHANLGLSFPTGSTTEKDDTPAGRTRLPYPMQLGSGTWDVLPGLTWLGQVGRFSLGAQAKGTVRIGRNDEGYSLGDTYGVTGWAAREIAPWVSLSLRLEWAQWFDIDGADDRLNPRMVPTADPDLRAGRRLDGLLGVNFLVPEGPLAGNRFAVEVGLPLYQSLDGPQLESDWRLVAGWQYTF